MELKIFQIEAKLGPEAPKCSKNGAKMGSGQPKKPKKNIEPTKKKAESHRVPPVEPKKRPTWLQVGFPNRSKIDKKSLQKSIVFLMPLGVDLWTKFGRFLVPK